MFATVLDAFSIAVTGTRDAILSAASAYARGSHERRLLDAVAAHRDGDVDGAMRLLRQIVRTSDGLTAAAAADLFGPILVMRHEIDELRDVAEVLERGGWRASAEVFRALAAAQRGDRREAVRYADAAEAALRSETNALIEIRVLQRLASTAYFLNDHTRAFDLAIRTARKAEPAGAWHNAVAAYSIAFNVQHDVLEDFAEADRFVRLWRHAARKTGDVSFLGPALVAEYTIAAQLADDARAVALERELRTLALPQQYAELFPQTLAHAMVRGSSDVSAMRTILEVLRETPRRTRGQWALCTALIALAHAAQRDDDATRASLREAIRKLGRGAPSEPAYERRLRRLARATIAFTCELLGDHVRAARTLAARESGADDAVRNLVYGPRPPAPGLQGLRRLYDAARNLRAAAEPPAGLSASEMEVLTLLGHGWSAGRIALETGRSRNTVYKHTRAILEKLDARRAPEAVAIARKRGFLS